MGINIWKHNLQSELHWFVNIGSATIAKNMTNYLTVKWVTFEITTIIEPSNVIFF